MVDKMMNAGDTRAHSELYLGAFLGLEQWGLWQCFLKNLFSFLIIFKEVSLLIEKTVNFKRIKAAFKCKKEGGVGPDVGHQKSAEAFINKWTTKIAKEIDHFE